MGMILIDIKQEYYLTIYCNYNDDKDDENKDAGFCITKLNLHFTLKYTSI